MNSTIRIEPGRAIYFVLDLALHRSRSDVVLNQMSHWLFLSRLKKGKKENIMSRNVRTSFVTIMLVLIVLSEQPVDAFLDEFGRKNLGDDWKVEVLGAEKKDFGGWSIDKGEVVYDTLSEAQTTINSLDAAIDFINDQRSNLGAVQNRLGFADSNLMSSIQNTESSLSTIRDADFALEASNLARTQILTQSGTAMLAQANQISQNILSLLK